MMVTNIRKTSGVAGQVQFTVTVDYTTEGDPSVTEVSFVGNVSGGPVVMISRGGSQTFVTDPERFGIFGEEAWVRAFFA